MSPRATKGGTLVFPKNSRLTLGKGHGLDLASVSIGVTILTHLVFNKGPGLDPPSRANEPLSLNLDLGRKACALEGTPLS